MSKIKFKIKPFEKKYMGDVILLLKSISNFQPKKKNYNIIWKKFKKQKNVFSIVALLEKEVVGYGTVSIETKIRGGKMGHIEDIVSKKKYRKKGIGKLIIDTLSKFAKKTGCYKISLQCKNHNIIFYQKCGYLKNGITMQKFF